MGMSDDDVERIKKIVIYYDDDYNEVKPDEATHIDTRIFDDDGNLVSSSTETVNK